MFLQKHLKSGKSERLPPLLGDCEFPARLNEIEDSYQQLTRELGNKIYRLESSARSTVGSYHSSVSRSRSSIIDRRIEAAAKAELHTKLKYVDLETAKLACS